ncbi:MAG: hypothetical protein HY881_17470 [Deltaproteobacteria bacterium]|nr:hypothetical protein [Deltaproteobacteria bacterium]
MAIKNLELTLGWLEPLDGLAFQDYRKLSFRIRGEFLHRIETAGKNRDGFIFGVQNIRQGLASSSLQLQVNSSFCFLVIILISAV